MSKWEGDVCCPDLQLLPLLADTLELSLDELFGRESMAKTAQKAEADSQILPVAVELPWEDDDAIQDMIRELNFGRYAAHPRKKEEGAA